MAKARIKLVVGTVYDKPVLDEYDTTTKWRSWRINRAFLLDLRKQFPTGFTNADAYKVYYENHWTDRAKADSMRDKAIGELSDPYVIAYLTKVASEGDNWMQMNVRNHLSAAAYRGLLVRIRNGAYRWTTKQLP